MRCVPIKETSTDVILSDAKNLNSRQLHHLSYRRIKDEQRTVYAMIPAGGIFS